MGNHQQYEREPSRSKISVGTRSRCNSFSLIIIKSKSHLQHYTPLPTPSSITIFDIRRSYIPLRGSGLDRGGGERSAALALGGDSDLSRVVVAVQTSTSRGNENVTRLRDKLNAASSAVLSADRSAVEADADLLVNEIRAEAGGERALNKKYVVAVPGGGGDLSVGGSVDAGSVDDLA